MRKCVEKKGSDVTVICNIKMKAHVRASEPASWRILLMDLRGVALQKSPKLLMGSANSLPKRQCNVHDCTRVPAPACDFCNLRGSMGHENVRI